MKKSGAIICTVIIAILLSIIMVRTFMTLCIITFHYDYAIWCDKEDRQYIKANTGISSEFNIAVCRMEYNSEEVAEEKVINNIYSIFEESKNVSKISDYIKEKSNKKEVILKSMIPCIIILFASILIFRIKLLPILTNDE